MKSKIILSLLALIAVVLTLVYILPADNHPVIKEAPSIIEQQLPEPTVKVKPAPKAPIKKTELVVEEPVERPEINYNPAPAPITNKTPLSDAEEFKEAYKNEEIDRQWKRLNERRVGGRIERSNVAFKGSGISRLKFDCKSKTCVLTGNSRYPHVEQTLVRDLEMRLDRLATFKQIDFDVRTGDFVIAVYPKERE